MSGWRGRKKKVVTGGGAGCIKMAQQKIKEKEPNLDSSCNKTKHVNAYAYMRAFISTKQMHK